MLIYRGTDLTAFREGNDVPRVFRFARNTYRGNRRILYMCVKQPHYIRNNHWLERIFSWRKMSGTEVSFSPRGKAFDYAGENADWRVPPPPQGRGLREAGGARLHVCGDAPSAPRRGLGRAGGRRAVPDRVLSCAAPRPSSSRPASRSCSR